MFCLFVFVTLTFVFQTVASKNISSQLNFGWQVQSISQTQENAIVEAVNVKSGERKVYRALYAVGCDGGKSFVRKSLGRITKSCLTVKYRMLTVLGLWGQNKPKIHSRSTTT